MQFRQLEEMQKDGEDGRKKLTAITRYVTVGLALSLVHSHGDRLWQQWTSGKLEFPEGITVIAALQQELLC